MQIFAPPPQTRTTRTRVGQSTCSNNNREIAWRPRVSGRTSGKLRQGPTSRRLGHWVFSVVVAIASFSCSAPTYADGPADNQVDSVRPVPPKGVEIPAADQTTLQASLKDLDEKIGRLKTMNDTLVKEYLPDVEIFSKAIHLAIEEDGFFDVKEVETAVKLLREGTVRADALQSRSAPWRALPNRLTMMVRGFRSKLDGSVQPYGIVFNPSENPEFPLRADVWCRGRSEKGLELQFMGARMSNSDPMPEPNVIMIHPFGRYCNANKLAGEIDTLEVLEHAIKEYPIDRERVSIRGFSMGGAAAWHLAVHYPDKWFAATPGAGFSETPDFLKVFQSEDLKPTWYEQKLWQMYDCPVWARNLRMLPTIAYSGEIDKQKQAADIMAAACWNLPQDQRFELTHIVAPKTAHQISPAARLEMEKRLAILDTMRKEKDNADISFTTTTLKYNQAHWLTIHRLNEHWLPANVKAIASPADHSVEVAIENVSEFSIDFSANQFRSIRHVRVTGFQDSLLHQGKLGATPIEFGIDVPRKSDQSFGIRLRRVGDRWEQVSPLELPTKSLSKKHDLQGPIDDAFMGPFLFVKPSVVGQHPPIDKWVQSEMQHGIREWHRQMRGDVRIKSTEELVPEDIENYNLILWGDPQSNPTIAKIMDKLPIQWNKEKIVVGTRKFDSSNHAPILIFPNPLNPDRYVVLNSSFTYREYDYLNNARQVPKLPDWAIVDLSIPANARMPGKIVDANFFNEQWELKP